MIAILLWLQSCFIRANNFGWANRAQGKQYMKTGPAKYAKEAFRLSAKSFHESNDFEHCLDVLKDMADIPDNVKEGLTIIPVSHVSEVLEHALVRKPDAVEWDEVAEEAAAAAALAAKSGRADSATAH